MIPMAGKTKTTTRRMAATLHYGLVVFTIAEEGIYYRQKGRRRSFLLPHGAAYQYAVQLHVARERAERKGRRSPRRRRV